MTFDRELLFPAIAVAFGSIAAFTDIQSRRIPNWLTGTALLAGLSLHLALEGWRGLAGSLAAALIAGVIFLIFHIAGGMGAGDVKLIAGVAALVGLGHTSFLLIFTSLAGGAMALLLALARGQLLQTLGNVTTLARHHREQGLTPHPEINVRNGSTLRLPYGVAIAAGCMLTMVAWHSGGAQ
jgi:prepilin peptidase CpaA